MLATARQALSPPHRAVYTRALCSPPIALGGPLSSLHAGAPFACGAYSCGLGAGVSGPDAPDPDLLFMLAAWPDWSRLT
jgi:hypothetical protein